MQDRTAVVTGAGQGLGRADARRLSRDGFHVVCIDRDGDAAQATAAEVGGTAFACDVTDRDAVLAVAAQVDACHALVNNAGIWRFHSILAMTPDERTARRLCLMWGVHSVLSEIVHSYEEMVDRAAATALAEDFARPADQIVVVAGIPFGQAGTTNNLRVVQLGTT